MNGFSGNAGATLEGINWYKQHKKNENMDAWRMQSEFPTTDTEAFASTGRRAFAPLYVMNARAFNRKPEFIGDITGNAQSGIQALDNIQFTLADTGPMYVWDMPDNSINIKNRYVVPVDIGGRTSVADYSIIRVFDRMQLMNGGVPEAILTWKGHLDQDLVIWKAVQIAKIYNNALLAPESNSLRTKTNESEGDHIITIMDEIKKPLPHTENKTSPMYYSMNSTLPDPKGKDGQGWVLPSNMASMTNTINKAKVNLIDNLNKLLREGGYIEPDSRVCDEYDVYEMKPDGVLRGY